MVTELHRPEPQEDRPLRTDPKSPGISTRHVLSTDCVPRTDGTLTGIASLFYGNAERNAHCSLFSDKETKLQGS